MDKRGGYRHMVPSALEPVHDQGDQNENAEDTEDDPEPGQARTAAFRVGNGVRVGSGARVRLAKAAEAAD